MKPVAEAIVDKLLHDDKPLSGNNEKNMTGPPISGVEYQGKKYTFYPYIGRNPAWQDAYFGKDRKGGQLGFIKTRQGNIHGRFYMHGQFFRFEPGQ